jgi:tRNA (mo5U34)-methyltransferase
MTLQAPRRRGAVTELEREIDELGPWFHNLHLPSGAETAPGHPLGDFPSYKWNELAPHLPADLRGWRALDIGCNAGFYAFELARRGAAVVAIDTDEQYLRQARWAARQLDPDGRVAFEQRGVYELAALEETFDLVLFLGVLYHLRHPLLALDLIHEHVAGDLLLFQSMQRGSTEVKPLEKDHDFWTTDIFDDARYPKMHFVEHKYAHDWTNWWVPNRACAEAMLRSAGFEIIAHPEDEVYLCRPGDPPAGFGAVYPARGKCA